MTRRVFCCGIILRSFDQRQCLFDEVIALAELVHSLVNEIGRDFIKAVSEVVKLLRVVAVVA